MADLEFRFSADGAELEKLLSDVSNLKVNFIDLDEVNRALNSSFKNLSSDVARFDDGLASASARAKQLHTDLEYIIGDINKIGIKDFDPTFGIEGDISKVGLKPAIGGHSIRDENDELRKFLGTLDYAVEKTKALPNEPWLSQKRSIDSASSSAEVFLRDLEEINKLHANYSNFPTSTNIRNQNVANIIHGQYTGASYRIPGDDSDAVLRGLAQDDDVLGAGSLTGLRRGYGDGGRRTSGIGSLDTQKARQELDGIHNSGRRATLAIVELSRGVEDAAVTFGTGGLAGALRASINNFSQFAFIIHPMAGAIAGLAGAITAVMIPAIVEATSETTNWIKELHTLGDTLKDKQLFQTKFEGIRADTSTDLKKLLEERRQLGEQEQATYDTSIAGLLGAKTGSGASTLERFGYGSVDYISKLVEHPTGIDLSGVRNYFNKERRAAEVLGTINAKDVESFQERVARNISRGGGESVVPGFLSELTRGGKLTIHEDEQKAFAEKLIGIEKELIEIARKRKEINERITEAEENEWHAANEREQAYVQEELAIQARRRKEGADFLGRLTESLDPEGKADRELNKDIERIRGLLPQDQFDTVSGVLNKRRGIDRNLTSRQKEIDERIAELSANPFKSLAGTITGAEELNKRITEAAGGYKDSTQEEIKRLREERKQADEEAKEQRKEANAILKESLTTFQQIDIYGVVGP